MDRVIVTVKSNECNNTFDLEVPTDLSAIQLVDEVINLITSFDRSFTCSDSKYRIYIESLKRNLAEDETLAEAGAWDGSILRLDKSN